ncbi:MAG: Gx transporter family protein [Coriobacteriia bacterium]|nr:Gx transporter family protein [Coriobacteriia bacterium]
MPSRADLTVQTAALVALAAVLGYAEAVALPPLPVPGVRLGLGNVAVVVALALLGARPALVVSLGRVLAVGLATGSLGGPASAMALAGAGAAWLVMAGLASAGRTFSAVGWSVAGAAAHVLAQLAAACVLTGSPAPLSLAPLSLALALAAGLATGSMAAAALSRAPRVLSRPLAEGAPGTGEGVPRGPAAAREL